MLSTFTTKSRCLFWNNSVIEFSECHSWLYWYNNMLILHRPNNSNQLFIYPWNYRFCGKYESICNLRSNYSALKFSVSGFVLNRYVAWHNADIEFVMCVHITSSTKKKRTVIETLDNAPIHYIGDYQRRSVHVSELVRHWLKPLLEPILNSCHFDHWE